jgi:hypothetical protein
MPTPPEWSPDFVPATAKAFTYEEDPPTKDQPVQWMDPRSLPLTLGSEGKDSPSSIGHDPDTCTWCNSYPPGMLVPVRLLPLAPSIPKKIIIPEHDPLTCPYCQFFTQDTMAKDAEACADDCECRQYEDYGGQEIAADELPLAPLWLEKALTAPLPWGPDDFPGDTPRYFEEKQEAYGPENVRELGFYGVFSRLASDKVNRLRNLMNGTLENGKISIDWADTNDESVEDTLLDIANYALILVALQRGWWGLPLADAEIPFS